MFGYITNLDSMTSTGWNEHIGSVITETFSIGIHAFDRILYLYDEPSGCPDERLYTSDYPFKSSDTFCISYNFIKDTITIYHNEDLVDTRTLNGFKSIQPAFSLEGKAHSIQVVKYLLK